MRYKSLGRTGLYVSELCLGTMTFGGSEGYWQLIGQLKQAEVDALVGQSLDAGINFIDTANVYGFGESERLTGQALRNLKVARDKVVVATKVFGDMNRAGPNTRGNSRVHILASIDASLQRLQLDHVDLYQIHGFDPATPIEETLRALDQVVRDGKVRYLGVSNWAAWQIVKALGIAERLGLARFDSLQAYYTLAGRDLEREIVPMLASEGLGLMVWSPLAGGLLSGKYEAGPAETAPGTGAPGAAATAAGDAAAQAADGSRRLRFDFPPVDRGRASRCIAAMRPIAAARGVSVAQIAIAWLLHQRAVSTVIIGAKRPDQLADNLAATRVTLGADELAALDAASALPPEYPAWMLERQGGLRRQQIADAQR